MPPSLKDLQKPASAGIARYLIGASTPREGLPARRHREPTKPALGRSVIATTLPRNAAAFSFSICAVRVGTALAHEIEMRQSLTID
jgi:hypothetical protein